MGITKPRRKHVWDETAREFVPERIPLPQNIRAKIETIKAIPDIRKIAVIAGVIRLLQIGKGAFWYDEGVSSVLAQLPWDRMIQATAGDVHPPGYYIILWTMARIGLPMTETIARIPSAILSVIAVYLAWILADKFELNKLGKYIVTAWVVVSPLQLHYAQEARMYALLQVEVLLAILFILDRKKLFLSVVLCAMLYTHNYTLFYMPAFALVLLWDEYKYMTLVKWNHPYKLEGIKNAVLTTIRKWGIWFIIPVLLWIPWALVMFKQMGTVSGGYWIQPVKLPGVIFVLYQMLFAYSMPPAFQGLGVLLTCGLLFYSAWRIYRDRPKHWEILTLLAFGPLVFAVILSLIWKPVLLFRGLIGTAIPLTILIVKAIEGIKIPYKKIYAYVVIFVTLLAGISGHYLYNAENKGMTTTWVDEIETQFENGDVVLSLNDNGIIAVLTYAPDLPLYKLTGCGAEPLGSLSATTRQALGIEERTLDQLIPNNNKTEDTGRKPAEQPYTRVYFISTVAPISPACEVALAEDLINQDHVILIKELANDIYTQAGVYLISSQVKY